MSTKVIAKTRIVRHSNGNTAKPAQPKKRTKQAAQFGEIERLIDGISKLLAESRATPNRRMIALDFVKERIMAEYYPELSDQYLDLITRVSAPPPHGSATSPTEMVREIYGGQVYEYYPLGQYVVAAPGVCGGRPTIKYHRFDARHVIGYLRSGETPEQLAREFNFPLEAVHEAIKLAEVYDYEKSYA